MASRWVALVAVAAVMVLVPLLLFGVVAIALVQGLDSTSCQDDGGPGGGAQQVGDQNFSAEQMSNARTITQTTTARRLPRYAAELAVATAIVESDLVNVDYGDRDSLGLFQQRPSQGWGTAEQITNPAYATGTFLDHLVVLDRWYNPGNEPGLLSFGEAAQAVQGSAYPERYEPRRQQATLLVDRFWQGPDNPPLPATGAPPVQQAAATGCGDQGGSDLPLDPQKLPPDYQLPPDPTQRAVVEFALAQLGKPYVWGAKGPDAFDCSGLMQAAWSHAAIPIPAGTGGQQTAGQPVAGLSAVQPGDLLLIPGSLGTASNPRHVGMYAGHGLVVNAYDTSTGVVLDHLEHWAGKVVAIRRPAPTSTPPAGGRA